MDKTFDEAIAGIRTAERGVDVREDIAQGMECVKQCAENSAASANAAASSATQAEESATAADGFAAAANRSAQDAKKTATETAASVLAAIGLTVADGKICAVYRRDST